MDDLRKQAEIILNIALTQNQINSLDRFEHLLIDWNKNINLTAIKTPKEIRIKHFIDSFCCALAWRDQKHPLQCIDIGTGAGFPGIVLKILYPEMRVVLVESIGKKATFCQHVVDTLDLKDITVINQRAEKLFNVREFCAQFDCAVARAVSSLPTLLNYLVPFIKNDGCIVAMKGQHVDLEMSSIEDVLKQKKLQIKKIIPYRLPNEMYERKLVVLSKTS